MSDQQIIIHDLEKNLSILEAEHRTTKIALESSHMANTEYKKQIDKLTIELSLLQDSAKLVEDSRHNLRTRISLLEAEYNALTISHANIKTQLTEMTKLRNKSACHAVTLVQTINAQKVKVAILKKELEETNEATDAFEKSRDFHVKRGDRHQQKYYLLIDELKELKTDKDKLTLLLRQERAQFGTLDEQYSALKKQLEISPTSISYKRYIDILGRLEERYQSDTAALKNDKKFLTDKLNRYENIIDALLVANESLDHNALKAIREDEKYPENEIVSETPND